MAPRHLRVAAGDDGFDPWSTDDGGNYSRKKFYVGSGSRESSENMGQVRVPNYLRAQMQRIIEQRIIPQYGTKHDFIRDAIYHRLKDLVEMEEIGFAPEVAAQIRALLADADTEHEMLLAEQATTRVERHGQLIKLYYDNGNYGRMWEACDRARLVALSMETTHRAALLAEVAKYEELAGAVAPKPEPTEKPRLVRRVR
jgi:DNA-binding SARP family transcriptional activator